MLDQDKYLYFSEFKGLTRSIKGSMIISDNITGIHRFARLIPKELEMSTQPADAGPIPFSGEARDSKKRKPKVKARPKSSKPTRTLPTARISASKQLDILRAYAAASGKGAKPATTEEASEIVKMAPTTIMMSLAFLTNVGLIRRADTGSYLPSAEVVSFLAAYEWDKKTASHKLGPRLRESWFGEALLPRISFDAVDEKVAMNVLGDAANAGPEYEKELRTLIDFMVAGGVVQRDGTQIKLAKVMPIDSAQSRSEEPTESENGTKAARVSTSFSAQSPGGAIDFTVNVHVEMAEFGNWRPERIQAFFRGMAEVLAAKAGVEKGGAGT